MFYVTSLDGSQVEPLINIAPDFKMEQSVDGTFLVSFSCFPSENNAGYDLLRSKSTVTIDGYDFIVEQFDDKFSKSVTAISSFFKHSKTRKDTIFSGSHTLANHLAFALTGIGWTYTVDAGIANLTNYINKFGDDNVISLVGKICKYHQCEYIILPNNRLHFTKQIGGDYDYQYRYKHNVSDVVLKEDTSNLATVIKGYGKDGLSVSYRSPNIAVFGELEADPIRDDRFTNPTALTNYIKASLQDEPELAIESKIPELTSRETGERIWLIYEPLKISMQTRILKQIKTLVNGKLTTSSVVFGNTLIKSSIDILVEQQEQIDDNKDQIDETNDNLDEAKKEYTSKFEQTDDRITLEVDQLDKSIAAIDLKADNINLSVNNRITQEMAQINIKADNINASVNNRITNEVAAMDIRADQIELSVNNLATNTNSSITQLSNNINLKIDKGGAITDINLSPGIATINADKINLNGAVMVNGSISGTTDININRDIYVGNNIYLAPNGGGQKSIIFDGVSRIVGDWSRLTLSAPDIRLDSNVTLGGSGSTVNIGGNVNFAYANSITGVVKANSNGIGISTDGTYLYVQVNGATRNKVKLEAA
ncbi:phage tail spike protein [Solibacillus sp. FSL R7-0668]|uniref:phage tail spike protein n=1 Tax=Solibacillus sp. FSL R7-0668 TaxID=2921688 RepID=UPI0030F5CFC2